MSKPRKPDLNITRTCAHSAGWINILQFNGVDSGHCYCCMAGDRIIKNVMEREKKPKERQLEEMQEGEYWEQRAWEMDNTKKQENEKRALSLVCSLSPSLIGRLSIILGPFSPVWKGDNWPAETGRWAVSIPNPTLRHNSINPPMHYERRKGEKLSNGKQRGISAKEGWR